MQISQRKIVKLGRVPVYKDCSLLKPGSYIVTSSRFSKEEDAEIVGGPRLDVKRMPASVSELLPTLRTLSGGLEDLFDTVAAEHVTTRCGDQGST